MYPVGMIAVVLIAGGAAVLIVAVLVTRVTRARRRRQIGLSKVWFRSEIRSKTDISGRDW